MENRPNYGIQIVDLTSGAFIHDPERAFQIAGAINRELPADRKMGIELYPILNRRVTTIAQRLTAGLGIKHPMLEMLPRGIEPERVRDWSQIYDTKVIRVHLPYFYNNREFLSQLIRGDYFQLVGRSRFLEAAIGFFVGTAADFQAVNLAKQLKVGVNAHPNVLIGMKKNGQLAKLRQNVPFVLAENSVDCNLFKDIDTYRDTLYDLSALAKKIVLPEGLDGLLYARDHYADEEKFGRDRDYHAILRSPIVLMYLKAMHLSGISHRLINPDDIKDAIFLKALSETRFNNQVRAALDIDPREAAEFNLEQQIELFKPIVLGILRSQKVF